MDNSDKLNNKNMNEETRRFLYEQEEYDIAIS